MTLNTPIYHTSQGMADVSKPNSTKPSTVFDTEKQTAIPAVGYVTKKAYITSMLIVGVLLLVVLVISILGNIMATPAAGSVDTSKLKSQSVTQDKIADRVIVSSKVAEKQIQNEHLAGTIVLSDLAAKAVDSEKIVNGAVRLADLNDDSVIVHLSILNDNLASNSVDSVPGRSVQLEDMHNDSVDSSKIFNLSIVNNDLADNSVDSVKIVPGTVQLEDDSGEGLQWLQRRW